MKVKYSEILNANEPLSIIAKEKVTIKEAVGIARIIKVLREEFTIYQEKQRELIDMYGETTEDGRVKFKDEESAKLFNENYSELISYEADLAIEPVKLTSDIQINAETILLIEKFIDFE